MGTLFLLFLSLSTGLSFHPGTGTGLSTPRDPWQGCWSCGRCPCPLHPAPAPDSPHPLALQPSSAAGHGGPCWRVSNSELGRVSVLCLGTSSTASGVVGLGRSGEGGRWGEAWGGCGPERGVRFAWRGRALDRRGLKRESGSAKHLHRRGDAELVGSRHGLGPSPPRGAHPQLRCPGQTRCACP